MATTTVIHTATASYSSADYTISANNQLFGITGIMVNSITDITLFKLIPNSQVILIDTTVVDDDPPPPEL